MIIYDEPADRYHARKAVSAGMLWDTVKPDGCPALAYHRSTFNPDHVEEQAKWFDIGRATHLLTLEGAEFAARTVLLSYADYKTQKARDDRDQAYVDGRTPLLMKEYGLVCDMHRALGNSEAAELFAGEGRSEVSYTWFQPGTGDGAAGIFCKARADRLMSSAIIDLKTAASASPIAFERAMDRDGHHLRAAWYIDGLGQQPAPEYDFDRDYTFVVIAKEPPHIVSIFSTGEVPDRPGWFHIKEESVDWGRALYRKALIDVRRGLETNVWSGYGRRGEKVNNVSLPAYRLNMLYSQDRQGEFEDDEQDIPY